MRKVENISEATHVKFFGVEHNVDAGTIDGKLYEIIDRVHYVDEDGYTLNVTEWGESLPVSYVLYNIYDEVVQEKYYFIKYRSLLNRQCNWHHVNVVTKQYPVIFIAELNKEFPETYVLDFYAEISAEEYNLFENSN